MNTRVNSAQQEILLDWLEKNSELASGMYKASHGRVALERRWSTVAHTLNKHGAIRDADKWQRVWRDWKSNTKKKVNKAKGDKSSLTEYEHRVLALIGLEASAADGDASSGCVDIEVKDEALALAAVNNHSEQSEWSAESDTERDWEVPSPAPATSPAVSGADPLRHKTKHRRKSGRCECVHCSRLEGERRRLRLERRALGAERRALGAERARLATLDQLAGVLARLARLADRLEARYFNNGENGKD